MQRRGPRQRRKRRREALEATVFASGARPKDVRWNDWTRANALINYLKWQGIEYHDIFDEPLPVSLRVNGAADKDSRREAIYKLDELCSSRQAFKLPWIKVCALLTCLASSSSPVSSIRTRISLQWTGSR
jgi:hypothetical protein